MYIKKVILSVVVLMMLMVVMVLLIPVSSVSAAGTNWLFAISSG